MKHQEMVFPKAARITTILFRYMCRHPIAAAGGAGGEDTVRSGRHATALHIRPTAAGGGPQMLASLFHIVQFPLNTKNGTLN